MNPWYTLREVAAVLHLRPRTTRRLLAPYRQRCHLAREGSHPRLVLWIPGAIVLELERARGLAEASAPEQQAPVPLRPPIIRRAARSGYLGR